MEKVQARAPGDIEIFMQEEQPVYVKHSAYFNGALPVEQEQDNLVMKNFDPKLQITKKRMKYTFLVSFLMILSNCSERSIQRIHLTGHV